MGIEQECFVSNFDKEKIQSLITNLEKLLKEVDCTPEESYVPTPEESKQQLSKTAQIAKVKRHLAELRKLNEMFDRDYVKKSDGIEMFGNGRTVSVRPCCFLVKAFCDCQTTGIIVKKFPYGKFFHISELLLEINFHWLC